MVQKGDGPTWEGWRSYNSRAHPFNGYLQRFFISGIAGITPAAPGWKMIRIRPHTGGLEWARASIKTVAGTVAASWEKSDGGLLLSVRIPSNTEAIISVPSPEDVNFRILEANNLIWTQNRVSSTQPFIESLGSDRNYTNFKVGSGEWNFKVIY